jgi:hypothetical protein
VRLDRVTDEALQQELKKQRFLQKTHPPESMVWFMAARIIHHVSAEIARRARAKGKTA